VSVARAVAAGLRFRPIETTARDALAWHAALPEEAQAQMLPPITLEREAEVLALWKQR
jgi:2'-hydroxyisoflavone reductase